MDKLWEIKKDEHGINHWTINENFDTSSCKTITIKSDYVEHSEVYLLEDFDNDAWYIDRYFYEFNATAVLDLELKHNKIGENDQIGAFYGEECRGIAYADLCPITNTYLFPMMVYGNDDGDVLTFKYFNHETGAIKDLDNSITFYRNNIYGDVYQPVALTDDPIITEFAINSIYPNPFNPTTTISYSIPEDVDNISVDVYDIRGNHISSLYEGFQ